jgi:RNA polymerase sigma-70 factor (ECF subfamily)
MSRVAAAKSGICGKPLGRKLLLRSSRSRSTRSLPSTAVSQLVHICGRRLPHAQKLDMSFLNSRFSCGNSPLFGSYYHDTNHSLSLTLLAERALSVDRTEEKPSAAVAEPYEQFVQLFVRHEPAIRGFVRSLFPAAQHADEILQETCLVLWRKFGEFEPGTDFLAWALTIARFEALKFRRKLARDRHVFSPDLLATLAEEAAAEIDRRQEERRALETCIQRLPQKQRDLIRAAYVPGVTIKEVAEQVGRSATSLYKALNRLRLLLLKCIQARIAEGHRG